MDLDAICGDWKGCGYSRERAERLAERILELQGEGRSYEVAFDIAIVDVPPDLVPW